MQFYILINSEKTFSIYILMLNLSQYDKQENLNFQVILEPHLF